MLTTYFQNCIMGNVFRTKTSPGIPTTMYIGLSTTTPSVNGSGVTEPSGGNYSRVAMTGLSVPSDGAIHNSNDIEFPVSTTDWGTMTYYVIYDAKTAGNLLAYGALERSRVIQVDSQPRFLADSITITLKNET